MTKLDRLIKELCPKGVEYKALGEIIYFMNGKAHENEIVPDGHYVVVNSKFISTNGQVCKFTKSQICPVYKTDILMVMSDLPNGQALAKCFLVESDDKYTLNQRICSLTVKNKKEMNAKFLFYIANRNKQLLRYDNGVDQTNLKRDQILDIKIAVPPLPIQREIVRILDSFTELTAELTARKKQHEYYMNSVFDFSMSKANWLELGKICEIGDGLHGTPKYNADGDYYFINGNNLKDGRILFNDNTKKVDDFVYAQNGIAFNANTTIFMSINGTIGNLSYFNDEDIVLGKSVAYFKIKSDILNTKYLYYFLQTEYSQKYYEHKKTGSTIKNLGLKALREYKMPVPPLEEQERIVSILDRFDILTTDITSGLSAEIAARQKQYEYYRDKLLTF